MGEPPYGARRTTKIFPGNELRPAATRRPRSSRPEDGSRARRRRWAAWSCQSPAIIPEPAPRSSLRRAAGRRVLQRKLPRRLTNFSDAASSTCSRGPHWPAVVHVKNPPERGSRRTGRAGLRPRPRCAAGSRGPSSDATGRRVRCAPREYHPKSGPGPAPTSGGSKFIKLSIRQSAEFVVARRTATARQKRPRDCRGLRCVNTRPADRGSPARDYD